MLSTLIDRLSGHVDLRLAGLDVHVSDVRRDSRAVQVGDLFAALPGASVDGSAFVAEAEAAGASAVLAASPTASLLPHLLSDDPRRAMALAAHLLVDDPTRELSVIGITGTNGKTTTAWMLDEVLRALGARTALLGTVSQRIGDHVVPAAYTTLEADDLARFARAAVDDQATHLVMEVSSHGIAQHRVCGVRFALAAFTNLSQDHLDFHGTMDAYGEAKAALFLEHAPGLSVIHIDSPFGESLATRVAAAGLPLLRCSIKAEADFSVRDVRYRAEGIDATLDTPEGPLSLSMPMVGRHNLENALTVLATVHGLGLPLDRAADALRSTRGAPGRLERIVDPRGVSVLVDYAHTPDALAHALAALRPVTSGRLIVVFGCGGDRDRAKRPLMGHAAGKGADLVVVTSDNPRTEEPVEIVSAILPGVERSGQTKVDGLDASARGFWVEVDRARAIADALEAAVAGDTVLIAGKGHEDYQIIGTEKRPFDDRLVARQVIEGLTS